MDQLPWVRVEQYLIELAARDGKNVVRYEKPIPQENELKELMEDFLSYRMEDMDKQQSKDNEQKSISNSISNNSGSSTEG